MLRVPSNISISRCINHVASKSCLWFRILIVHNGCFYPKKYVRIVFLLTAMGLQPANCNYCKMYVYYSKWNVWKCLWLPLKHLQGSECLKIRENFIQDLFGYLRTRGVARWAGRQHVPRDITRSQFGVNFSLL